MSDSVMSKENYLITVIICTYNRCDLLKSVMETLIDQKLPPDYYELIIVDNNSNDSTKEFVQKFTVQNSKYNIRYILEPNQGLSHARNRGWKEAKGEYVAYTDDDCKIPADWLTVAKNTIEKYSPDVFGGPYFAFYLSDKPKWFKDEYGSHVQCAEFRELYSNEFLDGANMFFRCSILEEMGGFDPNLGMKGKTIGYGEETALLLTIRERKPEYSILYNPDLFVYHLVPAQKMNLAWNIKNKFKDGIFSAKIFATSSQQNASKFRALLSGIISVFYLLFDVTFGLCLRDRHKYPFYQNYLYEHSLRLIAKLGNSIQVLMNM